jgi:hypothetical protein
MRHHAARFAAFVAVLGLAFFSTGCLVKDTADTFCLEPNGAVTWTVLETNIHATGDTPAERQREEDEFMAAASAGKHPNLAAFAALGGLDIRSDVISAQWPFAVLTEARFPDIAQAFQRFLDQAGEIHGTSRLERRGDRTTWSITIEYDPDAPQTSGNSEAVPASLFDDDQPTFFIRHGQFVEAVGFDITDDGRVATMKKQDDHDWDKDPTLVLSLTWVATEAVNATKK